MTVYERILALRLLEKQRRQPEYTARLGISVGMVIKKQEEDHV